MRDYFNARTMASWERSYVEPPCPGPEWVDCTICGGTLLADDAEWDEDNPYCGACYDYREVE